MGLSTIDWAVIVLYVLFALAVGLFFARRAGRSVDEFFLSGRSLPWWVAGTSMVATSFAADTPLVISGWVREFGIWKNWVWWCLAVSSVLQVFLFARWWRRGGVMTKAELAELRYGGTGARVLRATLGVLHAGVTNTIVLCWVMLAAAKIVDVLLGIDKLTGLALACAIALSYSLLAGFWGVVMTDLLQFAMAMVGAVALAWICWSAVGGQEAILAASDAGQLGPETLRLLPTPGPGSVFDGSFWTASMAAFAAYLGVQWWAVENVDSSGVAVQRIAASRDERQGMLGVLWYNVAHYALRPWCWIAVGLMSLIVLPSREVTAPASGTVTEVRQDGLVLASEDGSRHELAFHGEDDADWRALPRVRAGQEVRAGALLAATDDERAYVVMMRRYLPVGLLGLVAASLLAAFMSTIDTHVNLAASFFVNDVYRRFLRPDAQEAHYVSAARWASVAVLALAGVFAYFATSISDLFQFFLAFLGGVGPVYVLRWFWWRVRAVTEITAMVASALVTTLLTAFADGFHWPLGGLAPDGVLSPEGRQVLVALVSSLAALVCLAVTRAPDPRSLVGFYERVRPLGCWGPVRALTQAAPARGELAIAMTGSLGALGVTFGTMFAIGALLLGRTSLCIGAAALAIVGTVLVVRALRALL